MGITIASAMLGLGLAAIPGGLGSVSPLNTVRIAPVSPGSVLSLNATVSCYTANYNPSCSSTWFPRYAAASVGTCYVAGARVEGCNVTLTWNTSIGSYLVVDGLQTSGTSGTGPSLAYFLTGSEPTLPAFVPGAALNGTDTGTITCWFHMNRMSGAVSGTLHLYLD